MPYAERWPLTPEQCRMARAALRWSLEAAAARSGVHRNTIQSYEQHRRLTDAACLHKLARAFQRAGVEFTMVNGEDGVRCQTPLN